jgi:hypothetical protein
MSADFFGREELAAIFPKWATNQYLCVFCVASISLPSDTGKTSMLRLPGCPSLAAPAAAFYLVVLFAPALTAQGTKAPRLAADADGDHRKERNEWFYRGRVIRGKESAELRRRAYQSKLRMRAQRAAAMVASRAAVPGLTTANSWTALGPVPLASDASGTGLQDYHQVAGRATAVAIDPAAPTGNTVYIGGAQSGVWKTTNGASIPANGVTWTPLTDEQATLSIGAIAIQPGNSDPTQSVILVATGEADNSDDSYFGLGMLRSADGGNTWAAISTANGGALFFSGLGGTRMAFSTASAQVNTVVAAMATSSEGLVAGAITSSTMRGLYTSLDAGQTWNFDVLVDPGGATDANSATSVVYNASAGLFFAAVRYHGFYSSPDGVNWTRLANQPGGSALSTAACPAQSTSNSYTCPIYRAEMTVVPGRNEMYAWTVYFSAGDVVDGGIWQSLNGGASWNAISDTAIANCGDVLGCGVDQGEHNLELLAMPSLSGTDLYAGAVNLYKCSINSQNPACVNAPFLNLTHVYGCNPIAAPAHVHPDQHALAYMIPASGGDQGYGLMYFANDGGIYRALDGFGGLYIGTCTGSNAFDDLNENLGSMTQFVSFSEHPTDPNTLLGGTQDNGSPATGSATTNLGWGNVLPGDGGYNAIDPNTPVNFYASNPDVAPGGLGVQLCRSGAACVESGFSFVATSNSLGGDDGAFYFPYILDPQSPSALLIGTCRVWRGSRLGGAFTALSPNFDTLGSTICSGSEVNQVQAIAAGGPTDVNGSQVIYATSSGLGPINGVLRSPSGGHVWVTTNATTGASAFSDVTNHGPAGSINPNEYPISGVAIDSSDASGGTAYVTVMGFTGGPGHVWKTMNSGASWTDFTANLPDSPTNAVVVDPTNAEIYVGTDVGVFASSTSAANWSELGPVAGQSGFLPNAAVTALALFNSAGEELLRASTYGRGIWQYPIQATADYQMLVPNPIQTIFSGQPAGFDGTISAVNGYSASVALSCVAGTTNPPTTCSVPGSPLTPLVATPFTVSVGGADGHYVFAVQGVGSDSSATTHSVPLTLDIVSFGLTKPAPASVTVPRGTTSPAVTFQVTAGATFTQSVTVSCTLPVSGAVCNLAPGTTVNPTASNPVNMAATVTVPAGTATGSYVVTLQGTAAGASASIETTFTITVSTNSDFILSEAAAFPEVNAGSTGTNGPISIASQDGFSGTVNLSCPTTYGAGSCSISPASVSTFPATATLTIHGASFVAGSYALSITGSAGSDTHSLLVPFSVGDYAIAGPASVSAKQGAQATEQMTFTSTFGYLGKINASCDASAIAAATCTLVPVNPLTLTSYGTANLSASVNVPTDAAGGAFSVKVNTQDTNGAPSHQFTFTVNVAEDFTLIAVPTIQTVTAGQVTGAYGLTITPRGASFDSPVTLSCTGLPGLSQCLFSPSSPQTPGTSAVNVVMTISTTANSAAAFRERAVFYAAWLLVPGMVVVLGGRRRGRFRFLLLMAALGILTCLPACSGVSSGGGGGKQGTPPGTYTVTVTGSSSGATAVTHSIPVTLVVN